MSSGHMGEALSVYMPDLHTESGFGLKVLESNIYHFPLNQPSLNEHVKPLHRRGRTLRPPSKLTQMSSK
jgi:hypothetical protein